MIRLALPLLRAVMCDTGASVAGLLVAQTRPFSILSRATQLASHWRIGGLDRVLLGSTCPQVLVLGFCAVVVGKHLVLVPCVSQC